MTAITIKTNAHQFASAVRYVANAAARDDSRPVLTGINLRICAGMMQVAAADGLRLHVATITLPSFNRDLPSADKPASFIVDAKTLLAWAKTVKAPKKVGSTYAPTYAELALSVDAVSIDGVPLHKKDKLAEAVGETRSAIIHGTFPDFRHIIPAVSDAHRMGIDASALLDASKPYARGIRDEAKLGTPRTILYSTPGTDSRALLLAAAGYEMPDNSDDQYNVAKAAFAHVAWFQPRDARTDLVTVLNTNYLIDALTGIDSGATMQALSSNQAVRMDAWQTQYAYSTQLQAVIMPICIDTPGHPQGTGSWRDLNVSTPEAAESPESAADAQKDANPMQTTEQPAPTAPRKRSTSKLNAERRALAKKLANEPVSDPADVLTTALTEANEYLDHAREHAAAIAHAEQYAAAVATPEQEQAGTPRCALCDATLEPGDRFCPMCGNKTNPNDTKAAEWEQYRNQPPAMPHDHMIREADARRMEKRAAKAAQLAATLAPEPDPADVLPYSGAVDLSAKYSQGNVLRILAECPHATDVRGFHQWKDAGRAVMKGQSGILIYTPAGERENEDGTTRRMVKKAYVWDISQTEPFEAFEARQAARKAAKQAGTPSAQVTPAPVVTPAPIIHPAAPARTQPPAFRAADI